MILETGEVLTDAPAAPRAPLRAFRHPVVGRGEVVVLVVTFGFHVRGKDVMTSCPFLFPGVIRVVDVPVSGPVVLPVVEIGTMPVRGHQIGRASCRESG